MADKIIAVMEDRIERVKRRLEATYGVLKTNDVKEVCHAFTEDITEHPIVPTVDQAFELWKKGDKVPSGTGLARCIAVEWQRRMFRAEDPDAEICDLYDGDPVLTRAALKVAVREAYRRGQQSAKAQRGEG